MQWFPSPIVRAAARLQCDDRGRQLAEERNHLRTAQVNAQDRPVSHIDTVQREDGLGRVDANTGKVGHGRLPFNETFNSLILAQQMPSGAVHPNNRGRRLVRLLPCPAR